MSKQLSNLLTEVHSFVDRQLVELDARCEEHRGWLAQAVAEVRKQLSQLAPAAKKQRLESGLAKAAAQEEEQVRTTGLGLLPPLLDHAPVATCPYPPWAR